jgi:hypothetical protein
MSSLCLHRNLHYGRGRADRAIGKNGRPHHISAVLVTSPRPQVVAAEEFHLPALPEPYVNLSIVQASQPRLIH